MQITVLYVGSSLLAPLKKAERELNRAYQLELRVNAHNFGAALPLNDWQVVEGDLAQSDIVFVIHVMDGENATRLISALERYQKRHKAVIVINCMPDLMRRTRMGQLSFLSEGEGQENGTKPKESGQVIGMLGQIGSWIGKQARRETGANSHSQYLKLIQILPGFLKLIPTRGRLRDVKNYLFLFCYFLQPSPSNIRAMLLFALKQYLPDERLRRIKVTMPEAFPAVAIYHPDSPKLFETFSAYRKWYLARSSRSDSKTSGYEIPDLQPDSTIGLLLMRPNVVSKTTKHYEALIRAIEAEGLGVVAATSTLMDNRKACEQFFVEEQSKNTERSLRVSQIVSLTGFSFVGGPVMNDSDAAASFLKSLNLPYKSAVSLEMQTVDHWRNSQTGLNPVQAGMQVAIPEIDGATEPFVYGGIPGKGFEPAPLEERCQRFAKRLKRWNRLRTAPRENLKVALVLFCFPPNKGNIGTAADLDVFPSVWDTLKRLKAEGYGVELPQSAESLRDLLLQGNSDSQASTVNVAYRMTVEEYRRLCPWVLEIEREWGTAPGKINSFNQNLLIQGITLGNVFLGVQPTFGYEGDPMRLMMARGGAPHHGFMAFYTYLAQVFQADVLIQVGTHGALEFMPGKQVGLSGECWPDRLIGELPNIYLYSVNNPSEGSIARRRSYAELISYLTPPIENAGLYRELAILKDLVMSYRQAGSELERQRLFDSIEELSSNLHLQLGDEVPAFFANDATLE